MGDQNSFRRSATSEVTHCKDEECQRKLNPIGQAISESTDRPGNMLCLIFLAIVDINTFCHNRNECVTSCLRKSRHFGVEAGGPACFSKVAPKDILFIIGRFIILNPPDITSSSSGITVLGGP